MGNSPHIFRVADLSATKDTVFTLEPDAAARAEVALALGIPSVRKLRFVGKLTQSGKKDWRLEADLGATVVQDCVVSLDPVTTRIDETIARLYVAKLDEPIIGDVEMPDDDSIDPLPAEIDIFDVMTEALALALPAFPRKDGAELGQAVYTQPGTEAMTDESARPFAGLASLKQALENKDKDGQ